jgi:hypothetical protein
MMSGCFLIERVCDALLDGDCPLGTFANAGAEPVAIGLAHEPCFTVDDGNRALDASGGADAAAVAFFLVDLDYFPGCFHLSDTGFRKLLNCGFGQIFADLSIDGIHKSAENALNTVAGTT